MSKNPIPLHPISIDSVNDMIGNNSSSDDIDDKSLMHLPHKARLLRKNNENLIKNFQLDKPELLTNRIRKEKSKGQCFSVVDVVKLAPKDNSGEEGKGWGIKKEVDAMVQLRIHRHKQEKSVLFNRRKKLKGANEDKEDRVVIGDVQDRMNRVWDCINNLPIQIRMDSQMMFTEGLLKESDVEEFVFTWETVVDSLFHFQLLLMRFEQNMEAMMLEEEKEKERKMHERGKYRRGSAADSEEGDKGDEEDNEQDQKQKVSERANERTNERTSERQGHVLVYI